MKKILTTASYLIGFGALSLQASLLVYEGNNYGGVDLNSMAGITTNATGLTGDYSQTFASGGLTRYKEAGLSFGSNFLSTSGGKVLMYAPSGYVTLNINLDVSAVSGTLYSSYLGQMTSIVSNGLFAQRVEKISDGVQSFVSELDGRNVTSGPAVAYGNVTSTTVDGPIVADETYLVLARFTNVGGVSGGVADQFVFNLDDYDSWFTAGAEEGNLGTYATFTASNSLGTQRDFSSLSKIQYSTSPLGGGQESGYIDELRYGTTLADVVAVPEPSSLLLMAGGMLLVGFGAIRGRSNRA